MDSVVKCEGHDDLVTAAAKSTAMFEEHSRQLGGIFAKLDDIKTMVESNRVRAEVRDKTLIEVTEGIQIVNNKIENGLRSEVQIIKTSMDKLIACIDRRKTEREEEIAQAKTRGLRGFLAPGIAEFKRKASFIVVGGSVLILIWFVVWVTTKIALFQEGPEVMLRLLGII